MLKGVLSAIICFLLVSISDAHSTHYKTVKTGMDGFPVMQSFHVHVLYLQNNEKSVNSSMAFYKSSLDHFNIGIHCPGLTHNDYMCYFHPDTVPAGPFTTAQWAIYFLPNQYGEVVTWFMQHRFDYDTDGFTILVHPNSGDEYDDHSIWTLWGGEKWPMDLSIFE